MRVVALISGGKDSIYNAVLTQAEGHEILALANLHPKDKDELDSYMYQTVGHMGIEKISEAMELPLYRRETNGYALQRGKYYEPTETDEVEDLYELLKEVKEKENIEAVACGAILSDYQRVRVENVCQRLKLVSLTYLWRRDQTELLQEMIDCKIEAILIKVAALGLTPVHLGKTISELKPHLMCMKEKYSINCCGEGGEYETFTLDCPLFKKRIVVEDMQVVISSADPVCPVGYVNFTKLKLVPKITSPKFTIKTSNDFLRDWNDSPTNDILELLIESEKDNIDTQSDCEIDKALKVEDDEEMLALINHLHNEEPKTFLAIRNKPKVILNKKGWLWVAGIQNSDKQNTDPTTAVTDILNQLETILTENEYTLKHLVNVILYIGDMNQYSAINAVYVDKINFQNPPTRICVECVLPKDCAIIMEVVAFKPYTNDLVCDLVKKSVLHVQGISHWAPANIGPYSQSIKVGNITYISGQIALIPGTMELIEAGIREQCRIVLRHLGRIAEAMNVKGKLRDVVQGICFVTKRDHIDTARKAWEFQSTNAIMDYVIVKSLPRKAYIELQCWAHNFNDKFEYEETGCSIGDFTVSIKKRWNYESDCAAAICSVSLLSDGSPSELMTRDQLRQVFDYVIRKMCSDLLVSSSNTDNKMCYSKTVSMHVRIFYHILKAPDFISDVAEEYQIERHDIQLAFTIVPACGLQSIHDFISICAIRHE